MIKNINTFTILAPFADLTIVEGLGYRIERTIPDA
jgi:hypothetical protein